MNNMNKIIVTGSHGLIGRSVCPILRNKYNFTVVEADIANGIDLKDDDLRSEFFQTHQDSVGLVNLIGLNHHIDSKNDNSTNSVLDFSENSINSYFEINVSLVYKICIDFVKHAENAKSIVNTGSLYSYLSPRPDLYDGSVKDLGYTISKHALLGLTRQMASHLALKYVLMQ